MIFGINAFMLRHFDPDRIARIAAACHCESLGISMEMLQDPRRTVALMESFSLSIGTAGNFFTDVNYPDWEQIRSFLSTTADVGCKYAGFVLQGKNIEIEFCAAFCEVLGNVAAQYNVMPIIEPLSQYNEMVSCLIGKENMIKLNSLIKTENCGWILDICHCPDFDFTNTMDCSVLSRVHVLHLADTMSEDTDKRVFPCEGNLHPDNFLRNMQANGFDGIVELEVINPSLAQMTEQDLIQKISAARLSIQTCIVIGELAVHRFLPMGEYFPEDNWQIGGGAGMILRQLSVFGVKTCPVCAIGDDENGRKLAARLSGTLPVKHIVSHKEAVTSVVNMIVHNGAVCNIQISAGSVRPKILVNIVRDLPDLPAFVYVPAFPGYEAVLSSTVKHRRWKTFCDFGYYLWVGNEKLLCQQLDKAPSGLYGAILNGGNLTATACKRLILRAKKRGFHSVILTNGEKPVLFLNGETDLIQEYKTIAPVRVCCTCGAGDTMIAGIMYGLARGLSFRNALVFGIQTASAKIEKYGIGD